MPRFSVWTTDLAGDPGSACSTASRWSVSNMAMIAALPGGSASPSLSWRPWSTLRSAKRPTTAPAAAPTTVAASSGGAASPTRKPTDPPHLVPVRPRPSPVRCTVTLPSVLCDTRMAASMLAPLALTFAIRASKSRLAVSTSGYPATRTSVRSWGMRVPPRAGRAPAHSRSSEVGLGLTTGHASGTRPTQSTVTPTAGTASFCLMRARPWARMGRGARWSVPHRDASSATPTDAGMSVPTARAARMREATAGGGTHALR